MTIALDKKYRTRDGREVRIYAVDGGGERSVHGAIRDKDDCGNWQWRPDRWDAYGSVCGDIEHSDDLVEVKKKHVRWVNLYNGLPGHEALFAWPTRAAADMAAHRGDEKPFACIRVEFTEGQFDE